MTRTTISLPPELLKKAKRAAADRDISMAEFIRGALEGWLARHPPKPHLGIAASDPTLPPVDYEAPVPPLRTFDHVMGRSEWAVDKKSTGRKAAKTGQQIG